MTRDRFEMGSTWIVSLIVVLVFGLALLGCPETTDDDDTSDDDAGDDDTGSDDDAGEGSGSMDLTADATCGPIQSAMVIEEATEKPGVKFWGSILASTEPWTCALYWQTQEEEWDLADAWWMAYDEAYKNQDGVAACAAALVYYQAMADIYDTMHPPGSCTLYLYPSGIAPGVYEIGGQEPLRYFGWVETVLYNYYQTLADYLDGCKSVTDWASWWALESEMYNLGEDAWQWWDISSGTMTLGKGSDITAVAKGNEVMNFQTHPIGEGTLDFDLDAVWCSPPN